MALDIWAAIHAERAALADNLADAAADRWNTPSLCDRWTVRDVLAHMTATAVMTPPKFLAGIIGSGFSFDRLQGKGIKAQLGASPDETLSRFRAQVSSKKHPPGPLPSWLGETLLHAEDIRRPLGIEHDYAIDAATQVADFYKGSNLIVGAKRRIAGLRLRATDTDWSTGDGPEVAGPVMALAMAMTGRKVALDELKGDGVATLASRD